MKFSHVEKQRSKFLAAVSSLKRAAGIPDCTRRPDCVGDDAWCYLYTSDAESAQILENLIGNMHVPPHTEKYYRKHPGHDYRDFVFSSNLGSHTYQVKFPVRDDVLVNRIDIVEKMTHKLIGPTSKSESRTR